MYVIEYDVTVTHSRHEGHKLLRSSSDQAHMLKFITVITSGFQSEISE